MKFKDIFFSGVFFWVMFLVIYGILERVGIVPYIAVWRPEWTEWDVYNPELVNGINMFEGYIVMFVAVQSIWIGSQMLYWYIKKWCLSINGS